MTLLAGTDRPSQMLLFFLIAGIMLMQSGRSFAETWVDRDGNSWMSIDYKEITLVSVGGFEYFDRIFNDLDTENSRLNLCFGPESTTGKPTACLNGLLVTGGSYKDDQVRTLRLSTREYGFFTALTEGALRAGAEVVVSIDNGEVYASYHLNRNFTPSDKSLSIIVDSDDSLKKPRLTPNAGSI